MSEWVKRRMQAGDLAVCPIRSEVDFSAGVVNQRPAVGILKMSYTFGDNYEASRRLRHLAEVYEPETRGLLNSAASVFGGRFELGVDLGCGPGWSTLLIAATLSRYAP